MKFSVTLSDFQKVLQKTLPAVPPKSTLPVLEHLNFTLEGNELGVIATDQDITIKSTITVSGSEDGSILVPGRKLSDIVKRLGNQGELEFSTNPDNYEITIIQGKGKYGMKGLNPEEYLDLPELFESHKPDLSDDSQNDKFNCLFHHEELARLAEKTVFAVSSDEFRPAMTGVLFQFRNDTIYSVATDSYRLVQANLKSDKFSFKEDLDIIIPARSVELMNKFDDEVIMSAIETQGKITHTRFDSGNTVFITRIIDENFPPYESVIPDNNELIATINKDDLLAGIRKVELFTSSISKQIRVVLEPNNMIIRGEDDETGNHGKDEIPCDYDGEKFEIGFNHKYLDDALKNIDSKDTEDGLVVMTFSEPSKPTIIKPKNEEDNLLMLVMPVRLS